MSVEGRLRAAFSEQDESWEARAEEQLRELRRRHTRGLVVRRGLAAAGLAAAVVSGVVLVVGDDLGGDAAPDPAGPPSTPPTQVDESSSAQSPTVLEGRWRSAEIDEDDVRAALEAAGSGQYADRVVADLGTAPFRWVWVVTFETAELRQVSDEGSEILDTVTIAVDDDRVTLTPRFAEGATVHRFAVDRGELRLAFVSTSEGVQDRVPGEVWQKLLYDAWAFTRR